MSLVYVYPEGGRLRYGLNRNPRLGTWILRLPRISMVLDPGRHIRHADGTRDWSWRTFVVEVHVHALSPKEPA